MLGICGAYNYIKEGDLEANGIPESNEQEFAYHYRDQSCNVQRVNKTDLCTDQTNLVSKSVCTVMTLSFRTGRSRQTV